MQMKKQIGVIGGGAAGMLRHKIPRDIQKILKRRCTGDDPGA